MTTSDGNLFVRDNSAPRGETIEEILATPRLTIERIVSHAYATPPGEWYDQERDEWVAVLCGAAGILFEGDAEATSLAPGDYVHIAAHRRHRVAWTARDEPTIWLAIHYRR
jgi:cupin 2 domain-containing protein